LVDTTANWIQQASCSKKIRIKTQANPYGKREHEHRLHSKVVNFYEGKLVSTNMEFVRKIALESEYYTFDFN
jgi:hypothetical protein